MLYSTDNIVLEPIIKSIFIDMMNNNRDYFKELVTEVIEDMGLIEAMKEADESETVSEESIMKLLAV